MIKRLKYNSLCFPCLEDFNLAINPEIISFFSFFRKLFRNQITKRLFFQRLVVMVIFILSTANFLFGQKTWDGGAGTLSWTDAANWNLNAIPAASDVVVFNNQTLQIINVPSVTISKLQIINNSDITLRPQTNGNRTLTVSSATNDAIFVEAGSTIVITGVDAATDRTLTLTTTNTVGLQANIYGTVITGLHNNQVNAVGVFTKGGANATIIFNANSTYQHNRNTGAIPTATWHANSNCNITGATTTVPSGLGQNFGNFTWNCTGQTVALSLAGMGSRTISSLNILSTGTGSINYVAATAFTLSVTNYNHSGGTFNYSIGAQTFTLDISGNFSHTGGTISETSSGSGSIVFNGSSMQTYTSGGAVSQTIDFTVNSGKYLQMAAAGTTVTGNGKFTLVKGGTLGITSSAGITSTGATGNIQVTGTRNFDSEANYIYNGTLAQITGNGLPTTVSNLTFDNRGGAVTFNSARNITDNFTITSGSVANLGTFTHTAGDLTLAGEGTVSGSWGSSSSSATNQNDTYFAITTGILNVTNSKCGIVSSPTGIAASPAEVCSGTSTTLSVTNPGAGFTTDWFTGGCGGTLVGTGNSLLVSPSASTTYFARTRNTKTNCVSGGCANVTVVVNEPLPVSVNIVSSPSGTVCEGTFITFTATATNGGLNPTYQWKVNGTNVGTNSIVYSYEPLNGDQVTCIVTSDLQCVTGSGNIPVTYFAWDDGTKAVTDSDFGPDAISIGGGQYLAGGAGGTTALGPIVVPKTDINLNLGNYTSYNTDGVDYSISYRRAEAVAQLFTRGNSLIISGGSVFNVSYRIDDGTGSFTTVTSTDFNIPDDSNFHNYRFSYNPSDGFGRLFVDDTEVWTSTATPGKAMYWTGAGDLIVGANTDASGNLIPTFDNLSINGITPKTASDVITLTVNPIPEITTQPQLLNLCQGDNGSFSVTTSATLPTYQWQYSNNATGPWTNTDGVTGVTGHTSNQLSLENTPVGYSNFYLSCLITSNGCSVRTNAVLLIVNPLPATGEIIPD